MELDLSTCQIRTPTGKDLPGLYEMLMEVFVVDRPVFTEMRETGKPFYTWTPYALYRGNDLLGNVSLVPMRIWLAGQVTQTVGIASVATPERYRRHGIATHLMHHCLNIVDQGKTSSVLFTDLPVMYERLGFKAIEQTHRAAQRRQMDFTNNGFDRTLLDTLAPHHVEQMASVFDDKYPKYDGTVDRDPDYWQLYEMLFNLYAKPKMLLCTRDDRVLGYARLEAEADRLLVSEICGDDSAIDVAEALLHFVTDYARDVERELITFALPADHFALQILRCRSVQLDPEPPESHRETFMVRPPAAEPLGPFEHVQWSLADKF